MTEVLGNIGIVLAVALIIFLEPLCKWLGRDDR